MVLNVIKDHGRNLNSDDTYAILFRHSMGYLSLGQGFAEKINDFTISLGRQQMILPIEDILDIKNN